MSIAGVTVPDNEIIREKLAQQGRKGRLRRRSRQADGWPSVSASGRPKALWDRMYRHRRAIRRRRRPMRREPAILFLRRQARGTKIGDLFGAHQMRVVRQHDRGLDRAAMDAVTQFLIGKQPLRRPEACPPRGDREQAILGAQVLRDQAHRRAVAAMARDHHEFLEARARHALAERHPGLQRHFGRQRQRAGVIDVFGGNSDRLEGKERRRNCVGEKLAHPCQIGLRNQDVGAKRQMRAVLLGRRQRQDRDPARARGPGYVGPVDVGPVAGGHRRGHRAKCFFKRICKVVCRPSKGIGHVSPTAAGLPIMGQNDRRSPIMNPALLPRTLTAGLALMAGILALVTAIFPARAQTMLDKVSFGTNWVAEAEHGGFFQALADGTYEKYGLDVTIVPGGPNDNNRMLLISGKLDFFMSANTLMSFDAVGNNVPVVTVAAIFQKDPQVFLTHPESKVAKLEDLKPLTLFVSKEGISSYFQWLKSEYGFSEEKVRPYTFNPQPFLANKQSAMQGYVTSEPFAVEKSAGFKPGIILLADYGFNTYSTLIETRRELIDKKPDLVQRFVDASIIGWYNYLYGDNTAANALIRKLNPEMTDELLAYSLNKMKEYGIVDSGDTSRDGIGAMTDARAASFFDKMVRACVVRPDIDFRKAYTLRFVNKGVGLDLRPKN